MPGIQIVQAVGVGPKVYILGLRIHHALAGVVLVLVRLGLVMHDWHDRWWSLRDQGCGNES
jgi:hypothetical protein